MTQTQIKIDDQTLPNTWLINCIRKNNLTSQILREKVIDDLVSDIKIDKEAEEILFADFRRSNNLLIDKDLENWYRKRFVDENILRIMITRPSKIVKYREERWGPAINSLYLKYKESYDLITFNSLESVDFETMQEVYFRLKDDNASWDNFAKLFQGKAEARAIIGPVSVNSINQKLVDIMRTKDPEHIHPPILIGDRYAVVQLLKFEAGELNEATKNDILNKEFENLVLEELNKSTNSITFPS